MTESNGKEGVPLPRIEIRGPARPGTGEPMWTVALDVGKGGLTKPLVESAMDLRTILQDAEPGSVVPVPRPWPFATSWADGGKSALMLLRPALVLAALHATSNDDLRLAAPGKKWKMKLPLDSTDSGEIELAHVEEVLVAPILPPDIDWPPQPRVTTNAAGIALPRLRLVAGRLPIRISEQEAETPGWFLQLDFEKRTILGKLRIELDAEDRFACELTPDGVEFDALLPHPSAAWLAGAPTEIRLRVCLSWLPDPDAKDEAAPYALEIVGGQDRDLDSIEAGLLRAFEALHGGQAPLRPELDVRPRVPRLRWPLKFKNRRLEFPGARTQAGWEWKVQLDETTLRARLVTARLPGAALESVASLSLARAEVERTPTSVVMRFESSAAGVAQADQTDYTAEWAWDPQNKGWGLSKDHLRNRISEATPLTVAVPTRLLADRLTKVYAAAGALPPAHRAPYFFSPIERGWLQLRIPDAQDAKAPAAAAASAGAITGNASIERNGVVKRRIDLYAAGGASARVYWSLSSPADPVLIHLDLQGACGELSSLLWAAETSPTPTEILPSLLGGAAATRDLPLRFGSKVLPSEIPGTYHESVGAGRQRTFEWTLRPQGPAYLWRSHPESPLIAANLMTRSAASASAPSLSRGLVPQRMQTSPTIRLSATEETAIPSAFPESNWDGAGWPWPKSANDPSWGDSAVPLLPITLPGVELAPADPKKPQLGNEIFALRYDLPALDELFAGTQLPKSPIPAPPAALDADPVLEIPPPTALEPERLELLWDEKAKSLALTRTQDARATGWGSPSTAARPVTGLVVPFAWNTTFSYDARTSDAETLPLGRYTLGGSIYQANSALAGLGTSQNPEHFALVGGTTGEAIRPDPSGPIAVTGFAAGVFELEELGYDSRGFGIGKAPERLVANAGFAVQVRKAAFYEKDKALPHGLVTAERTADLGGGRGFWFRDLPMQPEESDASLVFEGLQNAVETAAGPSGGELDRERLPTGIHEWRFFDGDGDFDVALGVFRFRPLRLLQVKVHTNGTSPHSVKVLGSLGLEAPSPALPRADEAYSTGNLAIWELRTDGTQSLTRCLVQAGRAGEPITVVEQTTGTPDAFEFWIDASIWPGSLAEARHPVKLELLLKPGSGELTDDLAERFAEARLRSRLFGLERYLKRGQISFPDGSLRVRFTPPPHPAGTPDAPSPGISSEEAFLTVEPGEDGALILACGIEVTTAANAPLFAWKALPNETSHASWLGFDVPAKAEFDHASGAVALHIGGSQLLNGVLVRGFDLADRRIRGSLILLAPPSTEGGLTSSDWFAFRAASGYLEVLADAEDGSDAPPRIHHVTKGVGPKLKGWDSCIRVDWDHTRTSVIEWPIDAIDPADVDDTLPASVHDAAKIGLRPGTTPLTHSVRVVLRDHVLPVELLGREAGPRPTPTLEQPWSVLAHVHHTLERADLKDGLEWRGLDCVTFADFTMLVKDAKAAKDPHPPHNETESPPPGERRDSHVFAPIYRGSAPGVDVKFRSRGTRDYLHHSGIAQSVLGLSGLHDLHLIRALAQIEEPEPCLLAIGGGASVFEVATKVDAPAAVVVALPWLFGLRAAPPAPLDAFHQAGTTRRDWWVPGLDAVSGVPLRLDRRPAIALDETTERAGNLAAAIRDAFGLPSQSEARVALPVEQVYFEPWDEHTGAGKIDDIPVEEIPFFLRSLLAVRRIWMARPPGGTATSSVSALLPSAARDERVLRFRFRAKEKEREAQVAEARWRPVELVVLDRGRPPLYVPLSGVGLAEARTGRSRARLMEAARAGGRDPLWFLLAEFDPEAPRHVHREWEAIWIPSLRLQEHPRRPLRRRDNTLYASGALGWPSATGTAALASLAPRTGDERPLVSPAVAFSARAAAFGFAAWSPGGDSKGAFWLTSGRRVIFDRAKIGMLSPPARHLGLVQPRVRAPRDGAVENALVPNPSDETIPLAPITPPFVERVAIGTRPGVFFAEHDSIVVPAEDDPLDAEVARFGRRASTAPVIVRQLRAPRSAALPDDADLAWRRRTYVSRADLAGTPATFLPFRFFAGSAWILRQELPSPQPTEERRFLFRPAEDDASIGPAWQGKLRVFVDVAAAAVAEPYAPVAVDGSIALAQLGLLPTTEECKVRADLVVDGVAFPFTELAWDRTLWIQNRRLEITLTTSAAHVGKVHERLTAATADTRIVLVIRLGQKRNDATGPHPGPWKLPVEPAGAALQPGPPTILALPLLLEPGGRAVLPVKTRTLIFGDPAYDRQLASVAHADGKVVENATWLLSCDRTEYDLDSTLYFAFGPLGRGTGAFAPVAGTANLRVRVVRASAPANETPPLLSIDGLSSPDLTYVIELAQAHALPVSALRTAEGRPPGLRPGDQIRLEVQFEAQSGKAVDRVVDSRLVAEPVIAPPPAIYALVELLGKDPNAQRGDVPLCASAPLPQAIEFPDLVGDLAREHVRRRALFVWRCARPAPDTDGARVTLVKVDRSGGGQLPTDQESFRTAEVEPSPLP